MPDMAATGLHGAHGTPYDTVRFQHPRGVAQNAMIVR